MATRTPDTSCGQVDGAGANGGRLVDKAGAARYLGGTSTATIERLINAGVLPIVQLPVQRTRHGIDPGGISRRILIDTHDLDRLIDQNKHRRGNADATTAAPIATRPAIASRRRA